MKDRPDQQRAFFDANGYLVVKDLLSSSQLEGLRDMVDRVLDGQLKPEAPAGQPPLEDFAIQWEPGVQDDPGIPRREKIRVVFHLCYTHPFFWDHATRPEILDVVETLIGPDIKLYTDQMFVKPARHGSDVAMHQDSAYWRALEPPALVTCWLALDDATAENGCVHVLPGSHRQLLPHRHFAGPQAWGLLEEDVDLAGEIPLPVKAGSAIFHHSCLVHRSFPNRSDRGRRALASIYLPSTLRLVQRWDFKYGFRLLRGRGYPGCV